MNRAQRLLEVASKKASQMTLRLNPAIIQELVDQKYSIYDELTASNSAFKSFLELLDAKGGYRPSIKLGGLGVTNTKRAELEMLAQLYDKAQELRGDPRRAYITY